MTRIHSITPLGFISKLSPKTGKPKYGNRKTVVDGITFDSKAEARRYGELKLLEKAGKIWHLELQPKFNLYGQLGHRICTYKADFMYLAKTDGMLEMLKVVEDVKGVRTRVYRLKAKLFADNYGFEITEVQA